MSCRALPLLLLLICCPWRAAGADPPAADAPLTLRTALAATLLHSPELDAATLAVREREALALQAGRWPNPTLRLEAENIGGSGAFAGIESAESTLQLSQLIELGGKRPARVALAERERDAAAAEAAIRRATVLARTAQVFVALLAAQEQRTLLAGRRAFATRAADDVAAQVRAGAAPETDVLRARLLRDELALLDVRRAADQAAAIAALRALWGGAGPAVAAVRGDLAAIDEPPVLASLLQRVDAAPEPARWARELAAREAAIELERARAIPDVTIGAGPRYFSDTDEAALIVELTLPLPVFNRNQDAIAAARASQDAAEAEQRGARATLAGALAGTLAAQRAAWDQLAVLRDRLLPAAAAAQASGEAAYRRGALRLDELQDAQRALFDLQVREIELLADWHQAGIELERLLGAAPPAADADTEER